MDELITWFTTLDREFVFLLALPFAVAAAAGCAEGVRYLRRWIGLNMERRRIRRNADTHARGKYRGRTTPYGL
jgi:hypothetical protein